MRLASSHVPRALIYSRWGKGELCRATGACQPMQQHTDDAKTRAEGEEETTRCCNLGCGGEGPAQFWEAC